jgi:hypothetical protein
MENEGIESSWSFQSGRSPKNGRKLSLVKAKESPGKVGALTLEARLVNEPEEHRTEYLNYLKFHTGRENTATQVLYS